MVNVNIYKAVNIFREGFSAFILLCSGLSRKNLLGYYSGAVTKNIRLDCLYRIGILETILQEIRTSFK